MLMISIPPPGLCSLSVRGEGSWCLSSSSPTGHQVTLQMLLYVRVKYRAHLAQEWFHFVNLTLSMMYYVRLLCSALHLFAYNKRNQNVTAGTKQEILLSHLVRLVQENSALIQHSSYVMLFGLRNCHL